VKELSRMLMQVRPAMLSGASAPIYSACSMA